MSSGFFLLAPAAVGGGNVEGGGKKGTATFMSPTRCARDTSIFAARRGKRNGEKRKGEMGDGDRGGDGV